MTRLVERILKLCSSGSDRFNLAERLLPFSQSCFYLCRFRVRGMMLLTASTSVIACAINLQPAMLVDRIKNRGPVAISSSNPYIVANQYLDYQKEISVNIAQFLNSRGSPAAIEIQKPLFDTTKTYIYYPENGEYYILTELSEDWSVAGPYRLSPKKMRQIEEVTGAVSVR